VEGLWCSKPPLSNPCEETRWCSTFSLFSWVISLTHISLRLGSESTLHLGLDGLLIEVAGRPEPSWLFQFPSYRRLREAGSQFQCQVTACKQSALHIGFPPPELGSGKCSEIYLVVHIHVVGLCSVFGVVTRARFGQIVLGLGRSEECRLQTVTKKFDPSYYKNQ
jgi:hypothetical protein